MIKKKPKRNGPWLFWRRHFFCATLQRRDIQRDVHVVKTAQERQREKSIRRREKVVCADQRVYDLPETWQRWVRESKPKKNKKWVSGNVRKLVVQARLRMGMIERIDKEKAEAKRALTVLEKAFLPRNFAALIVVTEDPNYRSNLTTTTKN